MRTRRILSVGSVLMTLAVAAAAVNIPSGTTVTVRTNSKLDSGKVRSGESWSGSLQGDLVVNGRTVAPNGAPVEGIISSAKDSGRLHAPGELAIKVTSINGIRVHSSTHYAKGKGHTKQNVEKIGGGAAAGAVIGALVGGGKGAAIGAGAGGAAGTGLAVATGKDQAVIPAESTLNFTVWTSH